MTDTAAEIVAVGFAVALVIMAFAIAGHINRAQTVEFNTPYYAIRSSHYSLLES